MNGLRWTTVGATVIAMLACAAVALGDDQTAAKRSTVAIKELGGSEMTADKTFRGRYSLLLDGVIQAPGTTVIHPNQGATRVVDGQQQTVVFGSENLTTKTGSLTFSFRGVSIRVSNINPAKDAFDNEYGTWRVVQGTGTFQGWKGGGRWALVGTPSANNIEWDGFVTH